jgi:PAS domain S-box-containing protein
LHAATELIPDAVYAKDVQGRYVFVDSVFARLFGKSAEEAIGKDDTELFGAESTRQNMETDRQIDAEGITIIFEQTVSST